MPITLIKQLPEFRKILPDSVNKLSISEMFVDTIQGEGINAGTPATFIRLQGCTLTCKWCDTLDVWPYGNDYTFEELYEMMYQHRDRYSNGRQHIILTGGSPLKQQKQLMFFIRMLKERFGFKPFIEVENEAVIFPDSRFSSLVDVWNNSPKLSNSGMKKIARVKPDILRHLSDLKNSWFKFVVQGEEDWTEIANDFLPHIRKDQIILMPEGSTQEELNAVRGVVVDMAIKHQVRYMDRLHVIIWNKKTGV
jgi:7-carboxy-7-deazaguanine synthase